MPAPRICADFHSLDDSSRLRTEVGRSAHLTPVTWPEYVRATIGPRHEMATPQAAFERVMGS